MPLILGLWRHRQTYLGVIEANEFYLGIFQASWCYRDSGSKTNKDTYKTDINIDLTKQTDSHFVFCFQNLFHFLVTVRTRFHCLLLSKKSSVNVSYIGNKCSLEVSVEEN